MTNYLTDTERQIRPPATTITFRFWIRFSLRGQSITRWFESAQERDTYANELVLKHHAILTDRGEA